MASRFINNANISANGLNQVFFGNEHPEWYGQIFPTSTKTAVDINGGNVVAGDSILYTNKVKNHRPQQQQH